MIESVNNKYSCTVLGQGSSRAPSAQSETPRRYTVGFEQLLNQETLMQSLNKFVLIERSFAAPSICRDFFSVVVVYHTGLSRNTKAIP